jgi:hypothetical protein
VSNEQLLIIHYLQKVLPAHAVNITSLSGGTLNTQRSFYEGKEVFSFWIAGGSAGIGRGSNDYCLWNVDDSLREHGL